MKITEQMKDYYRSVFRLPGELREDLVRQACEAGIEAMETTFALIEEPGMESLSRIAARGFLDELNKMALAEDLATASKELEAAVALNKTAHKKLRAADKKLATVHKVLAAPPEEPEPFSVAGLLHEEEDLLREAEALLKEE